MDFGKKGKKYKDVSCLLFTDGERTWRGVINKIIPDKCYYHGPSVSLIEKKEKEIDSKMYPNSFGNNECIAFVIRMIATTKMHAIVVPVNIQN